MTEMFSTGLKYCEMLFNNQNLNIKPNFIAQCVPLMEGANEKHTRPNSLYFLHQGEILFLLRILVCFIFLRRVFKFV